MSKRDLALQAALRLFNRSGTSEISTNHIAEEAHISPGNLYYHFRNKTEIVRALVEELFSRLDSELSLPADTVGDANAVHELLTKTFRLSWEYRFYYREIVGLQKADPQLAAKARVVRERGLNDFVELFRAFVRSGHFRPTPEDEIRLCARLCWLATEFWIQNLELESKEPNEAETNEGAATVLYLLNRYRAEA